MNASRAPARVGVVLGGLIMALLVAWIAIEIRQRFTSGPDAQASSGMYAFGDLVLGAVVFAGLALVPLALGLYWLRPVTGFWTALSRFALLFALTGFLAVAALASLENSRGGWILLLSTMRFGLMPLTALTLAICALFAPQTRQRWLLIATSLTEGGIFATVVLVKFFLPQFAGA